MLQLFLQGNQLRLYLKWSQEQLLEDRGHGREGCGHLCYARAEVWALVEMTKGLCWVLWMTKTTFTQGVVKKENVFFLYEKKKKSLTRLSHKLAQVITTDGFCAAYLILSERQEVKTKIWS